MSFPLLPPSVQTVNNASKNYFNVLKNAVSSLAKGQEITHAKLSVLAAISFLTVIFPLGVLLTYGISKGILNFRASKENKDSLKKININKLINNNKETKAIPGLSIENNNFLESSQISNFNKHENVKKDPSDQAIQQSTKVWQNVKIIPQVTIEQEFENSLALLFSPPEPNEVALRRNALKDMMEIGRQVLYEDVGIKKGEFGNSPKALQAWTNKFPEEINSVPNIHKIYNGNDIQSGVVEKYIDNFNPVCTLNARTGLFEFESHGKKFGVIGERFVVDSNHYVTMLFDPIKKKYKLCDNLNDEKTKYIEIPPHIKFFTLEDLITGYTSVNDTAATKDKNDKPLPLCMDMDYVDNVFKEDDWRGLNWTLPKWKDNNCYLSDAWLFKAYKKKISDNFIKNSAISEEK